MREDQTMTATDAAHTHTQAGDDAPTPDLREMGAGLVRSFIWALEVRRRCHSHATRDRLDGEAIREILAAVERERG